MKRWLERKFLPKLSAALIRLLGMTLRVTIHDPHGFLTAKERPPVIMAFWHNRILLMPYFHQMLLNGRRVIVLISRSRDGNFITSVVHEFNMIAARGSSSRQGSTALLNLVHSMAHDHLDVAITPDGPRGPRHHTHPGVIRLSQKTGSPIVPVSMIFARKIEFKSWDRFQMPLPFTRCDLHFGASLVVSPDSSDEALERVTQDLTAELGN